MPRRFVPLEPNPVSEAPTSSPPSARNATMHVAVQGCVHGELRRVYEECRKHEQRTGRRIDFVIACGDFQAARCEADLETISMPEKYRALGDFSAYCPEEVRAGARFECGRKYPGFVNKAPYLTIFIGGNHEVPGVLLDQYYGGFLTENIYYLGHSGVIDIGGVRVSGISGIWRGNSPRGVKDSIAPYPVAPYNDYSKQSAYQVRLFEIDKLRCFANLDPTGAACGYASDIFVSHDWPTGITTFGDEEALLRRKPFLRDEIKAGTFGNPHTLSLLRLFRPARWFAAHCHCYFTANVPLTGGGSTLFTALGKCRAPGQCIEFIDIPARQERDSDLTRITIPPAWQAVIQGSDPLLKEAIEKKDRLDFCKSAVEKGVTSFPLTERLPVVATTTQELEMAVVYNRSNCAFEKELNKDLNEEPQSLFFEDRTGKRERDWNVIDSGKGE